MSKHIFTLRDLELAWQRVKLDIKNRHIFYVSEDYVETIENAQTSFFASIADELNSGKYIPSECQICDVPKPFGGIRPGSCLTLKDALVYTTIVGAAFPQIYKNLKWSQRKIDFAYTLNDGQYWIKNQYVSWKRFGERSVALLKEGYSYVFFCDITGYYENVDRDKLLHFLRQYQIQDNLIVLLGQQIKKWGVIASKGLPQGYSASDVLAKVYLNLVDDNMKQMGFKHLRYVDDFRFFCSTLSEAKRAQVELVKQLRQIGLNLQSKKSQTLRTDKAQEEIEGIIPILRNVKKEFVDGVLDQITSDYDAASGIDYVTIREIDEILKGTDDTAPLEILRRTYQAYFIDPGNRFDKSLFRFLLNRMGSQADDYAKTNCLQMLIEHPEETEAIMRYFEQIDVNKSDFQSLYNFLTSEDAVYHYQTYQILNWYSRNYDQNLRKLFIALVRKYYLDLNQPFFIRSISRKILGDNAELTDLDRIIRSYSVNMSEDEQTEIIFSVKNLESARRNSWYGSLPPGLLISQAIKTVKTK